MNDVYNDEIEQAYREGIEVGHGDWTRKAVMMKKIANHYGYSAQNKIMIEEMMELGMAILKLERGWSPERFDNLKEEVADVLIMAGQMRYMLGAADIDAIIMEKLVRQLERIKNETT